MTSEFCLQLCESAFAEFPYLFGDCQAFPKTPEKTEMVPELCKRPHKQVLYKVLQFGDRRLVRQRRIEREDQKTAVDRPRVSIFRSAVVRQIPEIVPVVLLCLFPDLICLSFSITVFQPALDRLSVRELFDHHMTSYHSILLQ